MKTTTCKRCGARDVAWRKTESGSFYLVEVAYNPRGGAFVVATHSARCDRRQNALTQEMQRIDEHAAWSAFSDLEKIAALTKVQQQYAEPSTGSTNLEAK